MGRRAKVLIAVLAGLLVLFGGAVGTRRGRHAAIKAVARTLPPKPVSVLVLGRQATQLSPLTDSIMLAAFNPGKNTMGLLSIPRDLWVNIPGHGFARINEAYMDGGPQLAERVVQEVTGIRPDYYLEINYSGFIKLINDAGGVTVDVKHAINDPTYPAPDECCGHYAPLHIPAGAQHMNGRTALAFMRERHDLPNGDLSREADQQEVLMALKSQFLRPANLVRLPTLLQDLQGAFKTDFPLTQVVQYAAAVSSMPKSDIGHAVLNYADKAVSDWTTPGGAAVLLPHTDAIATVVDQVFGGVLAGIGPPTVITDPNALEAANAPPKTGAAGAPAPAQAPPKSTASAWPPKLSFVVPLGGSGATWRAPLRGGSPVVSRLQDLLGEANPTHATGSPGPFDLLLGLQGGSVERLGLANQPGDVLIGGKAYSDPGLYRYLPAARTQAALVVSLAFGGAAVPGARVVVRGEGWIGPTVSLSLAVATNGGSKPQPVALGTVKVKDGRFSWSGRLPAKLAAGTYRLDGHGPVRANHLVLHVR